MRGLVPTWVDFAKRSIAASPQSGTGKLGTARQDLQCWIWGGKEQPSPAFSATAMTSKAALAQRCVGHSLLPGAGKDSQQRLTHSVETSNDVLYPLVRASEDSRHAEPSSQTGDARMQANQPNSKTISIQAGRRGRRARVRIRNRTGIHDVQLHGYLPTGQMRRCVFAPGNCLLVSTTTSN